jgi:hypothetical protein
MFAYDKTHPKLFIIGDDVKTCCEKIDYPVKSCGATGWGSLDA